MTDEQESLATRFEADRTRLRGVAYRMLGSRTEAEDAVQEAWLRLSRTGAHDVQNLSGWLTTVVARVCLDMLRTRRSRRELTLDAQPAGTAAGGAADLVRPHAADPEQETLLAESMGLALLVVLEMLTPAERVAFVLHDMFDVPYDEIAEILGRSAMATRQLASRARRRVRRAAPAAGTDATPHRRIVAAFLAASRDGDFEALLAVLDPEVVLRADAAAVLMGAPAEVRGAKAVADNFAGHARAARPALVNGEPGLVWAPGRKPRVVFRFTFAHDRIAGIELVADAERVRDLRVALLDR